MWGPAHETDYGAVKVSGLSKLDIAAHNTIIKSRHELARSKWAMLSKQDAASDRQTLLTTVSGVRGTLWASSVPENAYDFSRPKEKGGQVVVICTDPDCSSEPLATYPEARIHFRTHGLNLDDRQIIQLFGFKGVYFHAWLNGDWD